MTKNIITIAVKVAISGGLLYWLISSMDIEKLLAVASNADMKFVALTLVILIGIQLLAIYRWGLVLKRDMDISYRLVGSLSFVGLFFNNFLPTIVGGDAVKAYYLYRHKEGAGGSAGGITLSSVLASILMDRFSGFTALMFIALVALIPGYSLIAGTGVEAASFGIILFYFVFSLFMWVEFLHGWLMSLLMKIGLYGINEKIEKFYKSLMGYKTDGKLIAKVCFISLFIQVGVILSFASMGYGVGIGKSVV